MSNEFQRETLLDFGYKVRVFEIEDLIINWENGSIFGAIIMAMY